MTIGLSSPWVLTYKKIRAMFAEDKQVTVLYNDEEKKIQLFVDSDEKASALDILLRHEYDFGNVKLTVEVIPQNGVTWSFDDKNTKMLRSNDFNSMFNQAMYENAVFCFTYETAKTVLGGMLYVVFTPTPVQIYTDDLGCWQGYKTMLFEDIARDIFVERSGVFFSTSLFGNNNDSSRRVRY